MSTLLIHERLARCMAMLPATAQAMADDLGVEVGATRRWLRCLHAEGLVRPAQMVRHVGRMYEHGTGQPFDRLTGGDHIPSGLRSFVAIWRALDHRRHTVRELARVCGICPRVASGAVSALHSNRRARIVAWQCNTTSLTAVYDMLPGGDAPRPGRKPKADSNAEHWAKRRERLAAAGLGSRARVTQLQAGA